jgi:hypothetical protein
MDESGKNLITQDKQSVFIFGGMVLDKSNVYNALLDFKIIYQQNRDIVKKKLNEKLDEKINAGEMTIEEKSKKIHEMIGHFEFHAVEMFNPKRDKIKSKRVLKENPWKYCSTEQIFKGIHDILIKITPYIDKIYMFKVDKSSFIEYCNDKGLIPKDDLVDNKMIDFIINEYSNWLKEKDKKGAIVPDRLDSTIRDLFVDKIRDTCPDSFWSEPIIVESYSNAFIQIIDLITYCYYMIYTNANNKSNFNAIKKVYNKHIKNIIIEKDLVEYLNSK